MMQSTLPETEDTFDFLFKIILVGDSDVGKTCVVQSFKSGIFIEKQQNTIGVDFTVRTLDIDGKRVKVGDMASVCFTVLVTRFYQVYPSSYSQLLILGHFTYIRYFMCATHPKYVIIVPVHLLLKQIIRVLVSDNQFEEWQTASFKPCPLCVSFLGVLAVWMSCYAN